MMEERERGGVIQDFQARGSDPAKQVISGQVRGNESVPGWVVSIELSKDKSVRGVWKDVRIEGPGARIRRSASDGREVEVKEFVTSLMFSCLYLVSNTRSTAFSFSCIFGC